jgi:hypothetical protein
MKGACLLEDAKKKKKKNSVLGDSKLYICKAGALLLEQHLQSTFSGYFGDGIS